MNANLHNVSLLSPLTLDDLNSHRDLPSFQKPGVELLRSPVRELKSH